VSGEPVVLAAGSAPLVAAAGHAARNAGVRAVVIGGLGVICRLQRAHRATGDVDTATDGHDSVSLVTRIPGATLDGKDLAIDGVVVQVIDTYELDDDVSDVEPEIDRFFIVSHRYAYETAETTRVLAGDHVDETLHIATPAGLLATKAHALEDRHEPRKRASDTTDIIGLLDHRHDEIVAALHVAPHDLAAMVARSLRKTLVDDAARRACDLIAYGEADWALPADEVARSARKLCDEFG
jgi:hypothetical protein